jgi:hypothetical protein
MIPVRTAPRKHYSCNTQQTLLKGVSYIDITELESLRSNTHDCLKQWYRALSLVARSDGTTSQRIIGHSVTRIHSYYIDSF